MIAGISLNERPTLRSGLFAFANGAKLGWLIDPYDRKVLIYEPDQSVRLVTSETVAGTGTGDGLRARSCRCLELVLVRD